MLIILQAIRDSHHEITPRGEGNVCSVEFNLLYRVCSFIVAPLFLLTLLLISGMRLPRRRTRSGWMIFGKSYSLIRHLTRYCLSGTNGSPIHERLSCRSRRATLVKLLEGNFTPKALMLGTGHSPSELSCIPRALVHLLTRLRSLTRDEHTGRFDDGALAHLLQSATADSANAFRARGIPAAFKVIETLGIQQARAWGVCSLNEFRQFLGLKREFVHLFYALSFFNGRLVQHMLVSRSGMGIVKSAYVFCCLT